MGHLQANNHYPIVIAHRGASAYLPEHTLEAYSVAMLLGADYIEPDLVMTRDGHLIARHDNILNPTTDVAERKEFVNRKMTKFVDGMEMTGWFSEDFTLEEIKRLRAQERIPDIRPENAKFNGMFAIPTLSEIIEQVKAYEKFLGRQIGIYPETKHPTHFARLSLAMEKPLIEILERQGYSKRSDKVFLQSFEVSNLKKLRQMTDLSLIQLLSHEGKPYDLDLAGDVLTYEQMATQEGLTDIAAYADGIGPEKYHFIIPKDPQGFLLPEAHTTVIENAHRLGLLIHPYTFRAEKAFLPSNYQHNLSPLEPRYGDILSELKLFLEAGIDGFFIDQTDWGVLARNRFMNKTSGQ